MKKNLSLIIPTILGCFLAKFMEWFFQMFTGRFVFEAYYMIPQISVLIMVSMIYFGILYLTKKTKLLVLVPMLYYFTKEVYNIFIYPFTIGSSFVWNNIAFIALIIEPLTIGLISGVVSFTLWKYLTK